MKQRKYQIWDARKGRFVTNSDPVNDQGYREAVYLNLEGDIVVLEDDDGGKNGIHEHITDTNPPCLILREWTGLTDKNGAEIWEGDICGYGSEDPGRFSVVFELGAWRECYSEWDETLTKPELRQSLDMIEVIGNVYQNLELLT